MKIQFSFLKYDFLIQAVFFICNALLLLVGFIFPVCWILAVLLQIPLGIYQLLFSNVTHLFVFKSFSSQITRWRKIHFFGSLTFLLILILSFAFQILSYTFFPILMTVLIPQLIGYLYFALTFKDYQSRKEYLDNRPTIFAY